MSKKTAVLPLGEPSEDLIESDKEDATQKAEALREVRKKHGAKSEAPSKSSSLLLLLGLGRFKPTQIKLIITRACIIAPTYKNK